MYCLLQEDASAAGEAGPSNAGAGERPDERLAAQCSKEA